MPRPPRLWPRYLTLSLIAFAALVALSLAAPSSTTNVTSATTVVAEADSTRESFSLDADTLVVTNLVGGIEILPAGGANFEVEVRRVGKDADQQLRVHTREGSTAELAVEFPVDRTRRYRYPDAGRFKTTLTLPLRQENASSWLSRLFREFASDRIEVSDRSGEALWADLTIRVPRGKTLDLVLGAGKIRALGVVADLSLDSHAGPIEVAGVEGSVLADTGSGAITGNELVGNVNFDTGSGTVTLRNARGASIRIDTGSGFVNLADVDGKKLDVDTGSGTVRAERIGADDLVIDTGSGNVEVSLARLGSGTFELDTGSGSVELALPRDASAHIEADTGSGGVRMNLDGVTVHKKERSYVEATVGGGAAEVKIDTGSGSVTLDYV